MKKINPVFLFFLLLATTFFMACKEEGLQPSIDEIIKLEILSDTANLKADGQTIITLRAVVPASATDESKKVTFSTSTGLGTFQSSASSNSNLVTADVSGIAGASLKVGTLPGVYYISAQVTSGTQVFKTPDQPITLRPLSFTDKLSLIPDNVQPIADNLTIVTINVSSKYETEKTLKLTTNLGSFVQSTNPTQYTLPLDDKGNGIAQLLVSSSLLPHIITGSFTDQTTVSVILNPLPSRPDTIYAEPSSLIVDTVGTAVTIKTYVAKTNPNAKVSLNTAVSFMAYQLNGNIKTPVGRFTGLNTAVSDVNGNVSAVNFYGDTNDIDPTRPVFVEASAFRTATTKTTATLQLKRKPA